jgi:alkanesulfonate monooxygenase SsuD/methylene tetrahydromethanopterin reductase-like flavin-dependent oxidoreductase (luciferase family)/FAD/FMN-containing dehydrogenase
MSQPKEAMPMHYGHALQFGTFITPLNAAPETVVALAQHSETLGYDLVTFQDHPYQPAYLDTWTLMAWVAGQTERVQIAPNVLNLPLRQPAVIARAAASLDLLSSGRLALALGAGAYWSAIEAMGGDKLEPGEAVEALDEALDIIRAMLAPDSDNALHYNGDYYELKGAQPGPLPAHDIPLWLGAYKPRMLRLIGQKADGWLPSLKYMQPDDFRAGNRIIDEAAQAAGRDPREIRRLLNISGQFTETNGGFLVGPSAQWVDELLPLVVEEGAGTLILMTDDPDTMTQFAQEVAPALREAVARALPEAARAPQVRRASVRAKRLPGIDYDSIPASLADAAVEPGDTTYGRVKSTYMRGGAPGLVLRVKDTAQVIEALAFARQYPHLPFGVRSGGHGISGRSTNRGGIIIDLGPMNRIEVLDEATRRVRIEPGARWMDVAAALAPYGWALSSGDYGGVGVGGLATAGGIGWLSRKHGLTIDHLRAVDIVLADGSLVHASDRENADLFWAVRGAGANFGIVTAFEFEVDEVGNVGWAQLVMDASDTADLLEQWGAAVEAAPRDLTSFIILGPARRGQPAVAQVMAVVDSDEPDTIVRQLTPLANIAPLYDQQVYITSYAGLMANAQGGDHNGQGEPTGRSGLIEHLTPDFTRAAARLLQSGEVYFFQIRAVGGAVADVDPDATAYSYRSANFSVAAFGANRERMNLLWDTLMAPHFNGAYLSFETDQRPERLNDAFPPKTLERLRVLKQRYDPDNVFRDNFNLAVAAIAE